MRIGECDLPYGRRGDGRRRGAKRIDVGTDVLQALQFSARGMDPRALKWRFGDRLCFEGRVSVQTTLPFGTVDRGRRAGRGGSAKQIAVLGKGGGYILGLSHAVQAGTPLPLQGNIVAMFDAAMSCYPF